MVAMMPDGSVEPTLPDLPADFIVVAQQPDVEAVVQVEEEEPQLAVPAAFEQPATQLANANATVDVRAAEAVGQLQQGLPALVALGPRQ